MINPIKSTSTLIHFDEKAEVVFIKHGELLTLEILMAAADDINNLPGLRPGFGSFVDFRLCLDIKLTSEDTRKMNAFVLTEMAWRGSFPIAFVTSSKLMHGMSRMYASFLGEASPQVSIFEDIRPALEWVGLSPDFELPF